MSEQKERLIKLADRVEAFEDFDQRWHLTCTVGLAREMYQEETGNKPLGISRQDKDVAEYLGLTIAEVDALYCADYDTLNIGVEGVDLLRDVTREMAADVLRRLAARE